MLTIFDQMHLNMFDQLYGCPGDAMLKKIADMVGCTVEEAREAFTKEAVGHMYGAAHSTTACGVIERAIFDQGFKSITLKVSVEDPESGHLAIEVQGLEV